MRGARKRRLGLVVGFGLVLTSVVLLVLYALRQNISLFYSPTQVVLGEAPLHRSIRIGGMVVPGSIIRRSTDLLIHFKLTDYQHTIDVTYRGILPDLFREGQGIVAQGFLMSQHRVRATQVLAKHDENYMPKEVKEALRIAKKRVL